MAGKYDAEIRRLKCEGKGGRLIAADLGINAGHVSKRLKAMGLNKGPKNQHKPNPNRLSIDFDFGNGKLEAAAESFLRFICDTAGFDYADPAPYQSYDLLVDFGDGWKRVQVKATTTKNFYLTRSANINGDIRKYGKKRYTSDEVDYFFLFQNGRCWLVPFAEVENRTSVRPGSMLPGFEIDHHFKP
jgi:hypothetical protein